MLQSNDKPATVEIETALEHTVQDNQTSPDLTPVEVQAALDGEKPALRRLSKALKRGKDEELKTLAEALSPASAARLVLLMRAKDARRMINALDDVPSVALLAALDPSVSGDLIDAEVQAKLVKVIAKLPAKRAIPFLTELPETVRESILDAVPNSASLKAELRYSKETAGAVMERQFVAVPKDQTIENAISQIRENSDNINRIYAVYVIDPERHLLGYLKLRDLLLNPPATLVGDIMRPDPVAVGSAEDQEEVAKKAAETDLKVLPVVDGAGRLVGHITPEELHEIDRAEVEEDMKLMSGLHPQSTSTDNPIDILKRRLPWLLGGLGGAAIAAFVVGSYEDALTEAAILASLIPMVMSLAGNAGIQASTVTVQAQSSGTFWIGDLWRRILREIGGALLNGSCVGLVVACAILLLGHVLAIDRAPMLSLTALLTLVAVTFQASVVGSLVPVLLQRLGYDPAVATGVFITTSNDVVGVLIFFVIATTFYI